MGTGMSRQRELSNLQKKVLIFILSVERHFSGLSPIRYIQKSLRNSSIYYSCELLESAGLIRTQRNSSRRVFIALTGDGRALATSLTAAERDLQRKAGSRILPFRPERKGMRDIEVDIRGRPYAASRAAFVIRTDGTVSLALFSENSGQAWLSGNACQVGEWYQACYDAGLPVNVQVDDDRWLSGMAVPGRGRTL
ncbi:hypothetical protein CO704_25700 (plasmid) [Cedecea neteri]|uniref:Uncharacterized protein n=3 Tax=Cedecea neteri TaxID=158822 RepID=A0A291E5Z7_9ENTR|nr:hypothetical protein CO704_25700 [Cedecea neteri]